MIDEDDDDYNPEQVHDDDYEFVHPPRVGLSSYLVLHSIVCLHWCCIVCIYTYYVYTGICVIPRCLLVFNTIPSHHPITPPQHHVDGIPLPVGIDIEEARMLEAAMLGIPYDREIPPHRRPHGAALGLGGREDGMGMGGVVEDPAAVEQRLLRQEQDDAYEESLRVCGYCVVVPYTWCIPVTSWGGTDITRYVI